MCVARCGWDFNILLYFSFVSCIIQKVIVHADSDAGLSLRQKMLENQIQAAERSLQSVANNLVRTGVFQVKNAANQLDIAKTMETVAANILTTNGLNDVNKKINGVLYEIWII